jgi:PKD repeat protein
MDALRVTCILFCCWLLIFAFVDLSFGYARITSVEFFAPPEVLVNEEVVVAAKISTGNNRVEYVHNVSVTLIFPSEVSLVSGNNTVYIGEMGPGPAEAVCYWTLKFESYGEYVIVVNASCIDTQYMHRWMNASATILVYGPPHAEFDFVPSSEVHVNDTVIFDAGKCCPNGPNSAIVEYAWDFGDGTSLVTSQQVVEHKFHKVGNYTICLNVTDNKGLSSVATAQIKVGLLGDINFDGTIDIQDLFYVARSFDSSPGNERWRAECDLNHDQVINIIDINIVAKAYGTTA